jgi:hypothetical protein
MNRRHVIAAAALAIGLAGVVAGCSSSHDSKGSQGSFALRLGATGTPAAGTAPSILADGDDALSHLKGAVITISGIEARSSDGSWVPVETGLPADVDVMSIMKGGTAATLPADLLPDGDYDTLGLRITAVRLALPNDATLAIAPPGTGWTVRIPVNFSIVAGQSTVVALNLRGPDSFQSFDGRFEFDPEFEVVGVEHH